MQRMHVSAGSLRCLDGSYWLNDEVIFAFITATAYGTDFVPVDPCLIQTRDDYRIPGYPVRQGQLLFPLHMNNGTHWALALLQISRKRMILYDSLAFHYCNSAQFLPMNERDVMRTNWSKITDLHLERLEVASSAEVHMQYDGYSCGVYACLYAERICMGVATVQENATPDFLNSYRRHIKERICHSFVVTTNVSSQVDENGNFIPIPDTAGNGNAQMLEDDCDVVEECPAKIARKGDCYPSRDHTYSRPPKELSSPVIHSYIGHSWVSLCLLLHYLRMKHTDYKDIHFTCMGCNECGNIILESIMKIRFLVVIYLNKHQHLAFSVISRHTKNHGVVVDFTSSTLDKVTRANLKDVATAYGFGSCSFTRIPCMKEERSLFIEFQAIEICFLLKNGVPSFPSEIEMATNSQLLNVANDMENLLGINISLPTASQQVNLRENCLRRGHLQRNVPRTKKTANKRNTNLGKIGNFSKLLLIGEMDKVCRHCAALSFQGERKSICCNGGENIVPESVFNPNRDPLLDWFWEIALTNESIFYMIRPINNLLACAGININLKSFQGVPGQRPLVLQGRFDIGLCHLNPDSERACFAQLFIADDFKVQSSIQQTMKSWSTEVEYSIIKRLMDILRKNNAIVHSYLTMFEIYKKQLEKNGNAPECRVIMNLKNKREITSTVAPGVHPGRLNIPVFENQIAAIYLSEDGNMLSHEELDKGLLIMSRGGKTIAAHHSYNIDALTYPLYFPRGEQSFVKEKLPKKRTIMAKNTESQTGSQLTVSQPAESKNVDLDDLCGNEDCENATNKAAPKEKFMSRREFVLFILARRGDVKKHRILGTGKLYSQYVLHSFARIEADRLCAIGLHSTELRSSTASALFRYLDDKLREKGVKLGKLINMPQRYVGSRKWYEKLYGDAMAVAQRIGKPDLFITFTGSQDWPEIKNNLPGKLDSWITDPFLCCRVFFLRLSHFIDDIKNKEVFGKVKALHGSIEFQKRGMPHAHLLVTLHEKIDTPDKVDSYISAELPEYPSANDSQREEKLLLFNLVKKFMIHGPCSQRPDLACRSLDPNRCTKRYPKAYRAETEICNNGYPLYRRRNDGRVVPIGKLGKTFATNRDVVPTNHYLLMRHQCHINVEVCAAIQAFKYIFKYIFKGPDSVVYELLQDDTMLEKQIYVNETNEKCVNIDMREVYRLARYISHIEAAYRILGFPMQFSMHTVLSLSPHLPNEQPIFFKAEPNTAKSYNSKLLAYFDLVRRDDKAKNLTWIEVAEKYRFDGKKYVPYTTNRNRIARMWSVNPKMQELYAVRKLLLYKKGVSSFEHLRTHNGVTYNTYMEAAQAAGYIENSSEWEECLACACKTQMPPSIRRLYAHIVLYCKPPNPNELWHKFKAEMRSTTKSDSSSNVLEDVKSLKHIEKIITGNGMTLKDCGLDETLESLIDASNDINISMSHANDDPIEDNLELNYSQIISQLNDKQKVVVESVLRVSNMPKNSGDRVFFVYGKAGCGKTYTFNTLIRVLELNNKSVITVASTGIAATLLKNGRTAHSAFGLPLKRLCSDSVANVDASSAAGLMLRNVDVIIWDEISMQTRFAVECVDRLLRDVAAPENSALPFGGVIMVFGGDWCQFLPVVPGGSRLEIINETLKSSSLWRSMTILILDQNMRLIPGEEKHAAWLRAVGEGANYMSDGMHIDIPSCMCLPSEKDVINWIYTQDTLRSPELLGRVALLTVRNCDAIELNETVLRMIPGDITELYGIDTPASEEDGAIGMPCDDEEYLHQLTPSGMPQYKISVKKGAIVMLLRNIDVSERLCNGTRLEVLSVICDSRMLHCRNLITKKEVFITRMPLDYADETTGVAFRRFQFPIRLSFCMTINKSQGQTFDKVGIILRTPSFAHGSTYVALSRSRSRDHVKVTANWGTQLPITCKIRNVVYPEIIGEVCQ